MTGSGISPRGTAVRIWASGEVGPPPHPQHKTTMPRTTNEVRIRLPAVRPFPVTERILILFGCHRRWPSPTAPTSRVEVESHAGVPDGEAKEGGQGEGPDHGITSRLRIAAQHADCSLDSNCLTRGARHAGR